LIGTGIQQPELNEPALFPNPVTDYVFVLPDYFRSGAWQILNQQGQILMAGNALDIADGIGVHDLLPGIYWLRTEKWRTAFVKTDAP
jgi:hypothetical protein